MGMGSANMGISKSGFGLYYFLQLALLGYGQVPNQLMMICRRLDSQLQVFAKVTNRFHNESDAAAGFCIHHS